MAKIGAYKAKTLLSQLLDRVQKGERFVITKHGRPLAELVPVPERDVQVRRTARFFAPSMAKAKPSTSRRFTRRWVVTTDR